MADPKKVDRDTIFPAGIVAVWKDLDDAVRQWDRNPRGVTDEYLVVKWNRLRNALLNYEASPHG